ncbi:MAG: type 1 glutamine amidotransferase domain-containing protein [Mycobacteriales bacterium]
MSTNRVLFALTSHDKLGDTGRATGAYAPEMAHPAKVFREAGWDVDFVSVAGGKPPLDGIKPDDTVTRDFLTDESVAARLATTRTADQLDPADYRVIFYVGGHGTMWDFPGCEELADLAASIYAKGGVVAAVCHGPAGLLGITEPDGTPLIAGKTLSSFSNDEEDAVGLSDVVPFLLESALVEKGARHQKADKFSEFAIVDGRLVTGQNPASSSKVAQLALAALATA